MFLFRRIFRWSFSVVAMMFLRTAWRELAAPYPHSLSYITAAAETAVALVFLMAWWNTRKTNGEGRRFAVAASVLHLLLGVTALLAHPPAGVQAITVKSPGVVSVVFGLVGIIIFSRKTALSPTTVPSRGIQPAEPKQPSSSPLLTGARKALVTAGTTLAAAFSRLTRSYGRASLSAQATQEAVDRYRDRNLALLCSALDAPAPTPVGLGLYFDLSHYFEDRGMLREARNAFIRAEHFQDVHAIETSPEHLAALTLGNALLKRNPSVARLWFDRLRAADPKHRIPEYFFAEAAVLWVERRLPEANDAWQKASEALARLAGTANGGFHGDRCARLRFELDALAERQRVAGLEHTGSRSLLTATTRTAPILEGEGIPVNLAGTQDRRRRPRLPDAAGRNMWPRPTAG